MPASCEIGPNPPFVAPEFAIVDRLPLGSMLSRTAVATSFVVFCQISISRSFRSCSVSNPRRNER